MTSSLRHIVDGAVDEVEVLPQLSQLDRLVLKSCLEAWLGRADSGEEFVWVTPEAITASIDDGKRPDGAAVLAQELRDSVHHVGLAWVRSRRNGRPTDGRVLELVGVRQREGRPVAWRVRPGEWFRTRLSSPS